MVYTYQHHIYSLSGKCSRFWKQKRNYHKLMYWFRYCVYCREINRYITVQSLVFHNQGNWGTSKILLELPLTTLYNFTLRKQRVHLFFNFCMWHAIMSRSLWILLQKFQLCILFNLSLIFLVHFFHIFSYHFDYLVLILPLLKPKYFMFENFGQSVTARW